MTIAVDWGVKQQNKQTKRVKRTMLNLYIQTDMMDKIRNTLLLKEQSNQGLHCLYCPSILHVKSESQIDLFKFNLKDKYIW